MKLFKILSAVALASLVACSPEFDYKVVPADTLELETTTVKFLAENPGTREVAVESNATWTVSADTLSQWFSVEAVEGGIKIVPESNPDIYERSGVVTVAAGNRTVDIKVVQSALGVNFIADPDSVLVFPAEGGYLDVKVNSNIEWDAVPSSAWAESNIIAQYSGKGEQTLRITLPAREIGVEESLEEVVGDITFSHDDERIGRISFRQEPVVPVVTFSRDTVNVEANAFSEKVSVDANWPFTCACGAADSLWLSAVLPTPLPSETGEVIYPAGKAEITINGLQTKPGRSGKFTFQTSNGSKFLLVVNQEGMPTNLTVSKSSISAPAAGCSDSFTLNCNNTWEIVDVPSWVEVSKAMGEEGEHSIGVTIKASTERARTATMSVKAGDKVCEIALSQAGGPLTYLIVATAASNYIKLDPYFEPVQGKEFSKFQSSIANSYDLGVLTGYFVEDENMKMEVYARGCCLQNGSSGLRISTCSSGKPVTRQIRNEPLAYIKFPAIEGYKLTKISVKQFNKTTTSTYPVVVTSSLGESNADAIANYALTSVVELGPGAGDKALIEAQPYTDLVLNSPKANVAYYLMLTSELTTEYQLHSIQFHYEPVDN